MALWVDRENPSLCLRLQPRRHYCLSRKIQWPWFKEYSAFVPIEAEPSFHCPGPPRTGCQRKGQVDCPIAELPREILSRVLVSGGIACPISIAWPLGSIWDDLGYYLQLCPSYNFTWLLNFLHPKPDLTTTHLYNQQQPKFPLPTHPMLPFLGLL